MSQFRTGTWCFLLGLMLPAFASAAPADKNSSPQIVSATGLQVAHALRAQYGLHGSVILTQAAEKILDSFVDEQQAAFLWRNAAESVSAEAEKRRRQPVRGIDTHALAGWVLSTSTHGMTADVWQRVLLPMDPRYMPLKALLNSEDDLAVYLQLPAIWSRLLMAMKQRPHVDWQAVFGQILDPKPLPPSLRTSHWQALMRWIESPRQPQQLAALALQINRSQKQMSFMQQALLKKLIQLTLNKDRQQILSAALNWLEAFNIAHTYLDDWLQSQPYVFLALAESNDTWFVAHHDAVRMVDERLPELLEQSFRSLKGTAVSTTAATGVPEKMAAIFFSMPNLAAYLSQPFRRLLQQQLDVCLNLSEETRPLPDEPIEQRQYTGCVEDLSHWAGTLSTTDELAGSLNAPEDDEALARVLELPPWQIINTLYAMESREGCLTDANRKANPFEWLLGTESLIWFNDRWPQYLQKYRPVRFLQGPLRAGFSLQNGFSCLRQPVHDTLARRLTQVVAQWQRVKQHITAVADEYRQRNLKPGSDIDLLGSVQQASHYRPETLRIGPCDPAKTCGVHSQLEPSRALLALFPNHLLLADQLRLGEVRLCYDDVGWEGRTVGPSHLSNPAVANYYGHLAMSLKGYYNDTLVFSRRIQSLKKYHYLFGRNDENVLQLACPLPILGEQIITQLPEGTHGLLPNRLTFLTAARANPDAIVTHNWIKGEEWRDRLADDLRVKILASDTLDDVKLHVEEKFIEHTSRLQKTLYRLLLGLQEPHTEAQQALRETADKYHLYRRLVQAMANTFIPDRLLFDDTIHSLFYGATRLPDKAMLNRLYQQQLAVREMNQRFESNQEKVLQTWLKQAEKNGESSAFRILDPALLKLQEQKNQATAQPGSEPAS